MAASAAGSACGRARDPLPPLAFAAFSTLRSSRTREYSAQPPS